MVGYCSTSWNQVEEFWHLIFTCILSTTPRQVTDTIWAQFRAGALQRELLMAVVEPALPFDRKKLRHDKVQQLRRKIRTEIGRLNARTNNLAGRRNAAIHTAFEIIPTVPLKIGAIGAYKPSKLAGQNIVVALERLSWETDILVYDLVDLRDDFTEKLLGQASFDGVRRQAGLPIPRDERNRERDRLRALLAGLTTAPSLDQP